MNALQSLEILRIPLELPIKPNRSAFNRWFWEALEQGRFETVECSGCGKTSFPPRPDCPNCLEGRMRWRQLSGVGTLYTRTVVRVVPERLLESAPLPVGIVDLDDGVRLLCSLVGEQPIAIGKRVRLVVLQYLDGVLFAATQA